MVDLKTNYLGLELRNPLVASASPLSKKADTVRQLEDAGISAVVMYSLFEEQIQNEARALDHYLTQGSESFAEALSYFPDLDTYNAGPDEYLNLIRELKSSVDIPVIGSLNGISEGGWIDYAKMIAQAGAECTGTEYLLLTNRSGGHQRTTGKLLYRSGKEGKAFHSPAACCEIKSILYCFT